MDNFMASRFENPMMRLVAASAFALVGERVPGVDGDGHRAAGVPRRLAVVGDRRRVPARRGLRVRGPSPRRCHRPLSARRGARTRSLPPRAGRARRRPDPGRRRGAPVVRTLAEVRPAPPRHADRLRHGCRDGLLRSLHVSKICRGRWDGPARSSRSDWQR